MAKREKPGECFIKMLEQRPPEKIEPSCTPPQRIGSLSLWHKRDLGERTRLLGYLSFTLLLTLAFIEPLCSLAVHAAGMDLNSHILLVPFISAYLLHIKWKQLPRKYFSSRGLAAIPMLCGLMSLAALWGMRARNWSLSHNDFLALMALAFVCFLAAGGFLLLGGKWMSAAAFPIAFLIFMVPLPDRAVECLETAFKLASTDAANLFFTLSGTPVLRDGTVLQLPGIVFEVGQECSGIHSSWALFITSLLASYLFLRSPWRQLLLVGFVIPLGILRNGFRIWVIGLLCVRVNPDMIHSIIHKQGGPLFFALSLLPLFLWLQWLRSREIGTRGQDSKLKMEPALDNKL